MLTIGNAWGRLGAPKERPTPSADGLNFVHPQEQQPFNNVFWDSGYPGDLGSVDGTLVILVILCVSWGFQGLVIFWHDLLLAGAL